jgi:hypothetical protein
MRIGIRQEHAEEDASKLPDHRTTVLNRAARITGVRKKMEE